MNNKLKINLLGLALGAIIFAIWFFHRTTPLPADWHLGPLIIHFYTVCFVAGILMTFSVVRKKISEFGQPLEQLDKIALLCLVAGILGARVFFVLGNPQVPKTFINFLAFWRGGLAFYGGLIAVLLTIVITRLFTKFSLSKYLDSLALGLPLGQAIGRLGNFFNQEAYGQPTNGFWRTFISPEHRRLGCTKFDFFQPTFLWESLGLILIFLILFNLWPYLKNKPLAVFGLYAVLAGTLRFAIENLRLDALHWGSLLPSQLAAIVLVSTGLIILSLHARKVN